MKKEFKKKLIESNEKAWPLARKNILIMSSYLENRTFEEGTGAKDIFRLMLGCNAIVVGELYANTEHYRKYKPQNYTEEDFVDMVIESIGHNTPQRNDFKAIAEYVENFRSILWGYAMKHCVEYLKLYTELSKHIDKDSTVGYLRECMTIVIVECILKDMEESILR